MSHINVELTRNIEIGAVRIDGQEGLDIQRQDNGKEVRNARTEADPRRWEIAGYTCTSTNADYIATRQMWTDTERGLHTFNFYCFVDEEVVKVRFDSPFQVSAPVRHLRKVETFTIVESFDE